MGPLFNCQNHPKKIFLEKRILKFTNIVPYPLRQMQLGMSVTPTLERQTEESQFQASLGDKGRPSLKRKKPILWKFKSLLQELKMTKTDRKHSQIHLLEDLI